MNPMATSVCLGPQNAVLIGTRSGEIIEAKGTQPPAVRMRAHFDLDLWGSEMHPQTLRWSLSVETPCYPSGTYHSQAEAP